MAFTDLKDVWCADIVDTDGRVQADGKWTSVFPEDTGVAQEIQFNPFLTAPGQAASLPSVSIQRGSVVYPNGNPGIGVRLDGVWTGFDTPAVQSFGMWPPSNIGWAPSDPVIWQRQAAGRPVTTTASGNLRQDYFLDLVSGYSFSVAGGLAQFADDADENETLRVAVLPGGLVFAHWDRLSSLTGVLSVGILGSTWLPRGGVHAWDFFHGNPVSVRVAMSDSGSGELRDATLRIRGAGTGTSLVQGDTDTGSSFALRRSQVTVGDFEAELEAVVWWNSINIAGGDLFTPIGDRNNSRLILGWEYAPIGAPGINMIGGN